MSGILRFLVPLNQDIEQSEVEYENVVPVGGQTDDIALPTIIQKVALKYTGVHNKAWQETFHILMQEVLSHSDFIYIKINLDKYNISAVNYNRYPNHPAFYTYLFDFYNHDSHEDDLNTSFLKFYQTYTFQMGN